MGKVPLAHDVMADLSAHLYKNLPSLRNLPNELRIFYACGPGQAARRGLHVGTCLSDRGLVIVPREKEECFMLEKPSSLFFVAEEAAGEPNIVVGAKIRAAIQSGDAAYVSSVCPPAVARFVLSPTASELGAFSNDFQYLRPEAARGALRLIDASAETEAREKFVAVLKAWSGPEGTIPIDDVARLLEVLDPSWTNSELKTFSSGVVGVSKNGSGIACSDLVDWLFSKSGYN